MAAMQPATITRGDATVAWRTTPWDADGLGVAATLELTSITGADPAALAAALAEVDAVAAACGAALVTTRVAAADVALGRIDFEYMVE